MATRIWSVARQGERGLIAVHRGNPDAYSPTSPIAFANIEVGSFRRDSLSEPQVWNRRLYPSF